MFFFTNRHLFHQPNHESSLTSGIFIVLISLLATTGISAYAHGDPVIRINAGGGDYIDTTGHLWSADTGFNLGNIGSTSSPISATDDDFLFQTIRWNSSANLELAYAFSVPDGDYQVKLHFAETYSANFGVGRRVFDIFLENQRVLNNLDIYREAGAETALIKSFIVTVTDGQLNLALVHEIKNPMISAIEIQPALSESHMTLSWPPVSDKVSGYRIYYGLTSDTATQLLLDLHIASDEVNAKSPSVTLQASADLGIHKGDTACFRITAYDSSGESEFSQPLCKIF